MNIVYTETLNHPAHGTADVHALRLVSEAAVGDGQRMIRLVLGNVHADGTFVPTHKRVFADDEEATLSALVAKPMNAMRVCAPAGEPVLAQAVDEPSLAWMATPSCWATWAIRNQLGLCLDALAQTRRRRK